MDSDNSWHVQLSFSTLHEDRVIRALSDKLSVRTSGEWLFQDTSPSDVTTHTLPAKMAGIPTTISKQSYSGWGHPIYYLNKVIPLSEIDRHKEIFSELESDSLLGFVLIDYGILPTDLAED